MTKTSLYKTLRIDESKCVNCHACISICPVKYCNDGSKEVVALNNDMCISCGKCVSICTHNARELIDDFDDFINALISGEKLIAVSTPSVAASFPGLHFNVNGLLKNLGVEAIFDVSFGAELTTQSYIEYIKKHEPKTVIAQPCAAIVTYIELYLPELLKYLIPVDSPIIHTIKFIKKHYPKYKDHKIAVISPCAAKKREFEETGFGDYNVTHKSIDEFIKRENLVLNEITPIGFSNPSPGRAVLFSSPGGLVYTAKRWIPDIDEKTRKIEGVPLIYEYLQSLPKMIKKGYSPLLIDCLSCELGCNGGPLANVQEKAHDEIDYWVKNRRKEEKKRFLKESKLKEKKRSKKIINFLKEYNDLDYYTRSYVNRWGNIDLKYPNKEQISEIFLKMHKYREEDIKNCSSCGYNSCEGMATAIHNKLNKSENCHFYLLKETDISHEETRKSKFRLSNILETSLDGFIEIDNNSVIVDTNPAMQQILKRKDIIGRNIYEFLDEGSKEVYGQQFMQKSKVKEASYEIDVVQSTGDIIHCLFSSSGLYSVSGEKTGSFSMVSDITLLKKVQNELKKSNEDLEEKVLLRTASLSEANEELRTNAETIAQINKELEKLSIVASETDNAVIIMDKKGNFEWVNKAYTKMYGYDINELKAQKIENIIRIRNSNGFPEILQYVVKNKISHTFSGRDENSAGKFIYKQTTISPVLNSDNEVIKLVSIDTDITELKKAEEEILQRNEEIYQQKEEILSQRDEISAQKDRVTKQNLRITDSINYAKRIQQAVLPPVDMFQNYFSDYFLIFKPQDIVSGDFYWLHKTEDKIIVVAADCTGHGVPGAFMSMLGISMLNEIVIRERIFEADNILNVLRKNVKRSLRQTGKILEQQEGMDISLCIIDTSKNTMQFAGAYNPMYMIRNGELHIYQADRMPIGIHRKDSEDFSVHTIELQKNDVFYLLSDGYADQIGGERNRKFMHRNLKKFILDIHSKSMKEQKENLEDVYEAWKGKNFQVDDILIIGFKPFLKNAT